MFRCNLTNGRGKTNLFDVELLLIVNATVEFSLFLCANNYSQELSAAFVFLPALPPFSSPLHVHVLLLHLSSMFLCAHEKFPSWWKSTQSTLLLPSVSRDTHLLVSNNHCSKNKSFNVLFHSMWTWWTRFLLVTRYLKQYYPERIIADQTVSFRFMITNHVK